MKALTTNRVPTKRFPVFISNASFSDSFDELVLRAKDSFEKYEEYESITMKSTDKSWFLAEKWQAGERKADEDLKAGRYSEHKSMGDAIAYLHDQKKKGQK